MEFSLISVETLLNWANQLGEVDISERDDVPNNRNKVRKSAWK